MSQNYEVELTLYRQLSRRSNDLDSEGKPSGLSPMPWQEERVTLVGFGTFQVMERKARRGINPQTRETIEIPAKRVPKFVPRNGLKNKVG